MEKKIESQAARQRAFKELRTAYAEYEENNKDRFNRIEKFFPGTIVTVTINLKDEQAYLYDEATNNVIIF